MSVAVSASTLLLCCVVQMSQGNTPIYVLAFNSTHVHTVHEPSTFYIQSDHYSGAVLESTLYSGAKAETTYKKSLFPVEIECCWCCSVSSRTGDATYWKDYVSLIGNDANIRQSGPQNVSATLCQGTHIASFEKTSNKSWIGFQLKFVCGFPPPTPTTMPPPSTTQQPSTARTSSTKLTPTRLPSVTSVPMRPVSEARTKLGPTLPKAAENGIKSSDGHADSGWSPLAIGALVLGVTCCCALVLLMGIYRVRRHRAEVGGVGVCADFSSKPGEDTGPSHSRLDTHSVSAKRTRESAALGPGTSLTYPMASCGKVNLASSTGPSATYPMASSARISTVTLSTQLTATGPSTNTSTQGAMFATVNSLVDYGKAPWQSTMKTSESSVNNESLYSLDTNKTHTSTGTGHNKSKRSSKTKL